MSDDIECLKDGSRFCEGGRVFISALSLIISSVRRMWTNLHRKKINLKCSLIFYIVFIHRRAWRRCNIASLFRMLQSLASSSCVRLMQNHKSTWYFASLLLGYVLYLVFGAIIFSSVELPYEDLLRQELRAVKQRFLQENQCLSEERLERFLKTALDASSYGVSILNNASMNWNWDFTSSLFFASTVLSTTGECGSGRGGCGSLPGAQQKSCNIFASASMCVLNE